MHTSASFEKELKRSRGLYKTRQYVAPNPTPPKVFLATSIFNLLVHVAFAYWVLYLRCGQRGVDDEHEHEFAGMGPSSGPHTLRVENHYDAGAAAGVEPPGGLRHLRPAQHQQHADDQTGDAHQDQVQQSSITYSRSHEFSIGFLLFLASALAVLSLGRKFHVDYARYAGAVSGFLGLVLLLTWIEISFVREARELWGVLMRGTTVFEFGMTADFASAPPHSTQSQPQSTTTTSITNNYIVSRWYVFVAVCEILAAQSGFQLYRGHRDYVLQCFIQENSCAEVGTQNGEKIVNVM